MVSSVSNNPVSAKNYEAVANNDHASKGAVDSINDKQGNGKIAYGDYNGSSNSMSSKAPDKSSNDEKLNELDGMLSRLKEMLGGKESPDTKKKDTTLDDDKSNPDKKGGVDKDSKVDKKDQVDGGGTADKLDKEEKVDNGEKVDKEEKLDKEGGADDSGETSDKGLKDKAMDVLRKMSDVLLSIFGKTTN